MGYRIVASEVTRLVPMVVVIVREGTSKLEEHSARSRGSEIPHECYAKTKERTVHATLAVRP